MNEPDYIMVTHNEDVVPDSDPGDGYTVMVNSSPATVSYGEHVGPRIIGLKLNSAVTAGQTVTVTYTRRSSR